MSNTLYTRLILRNDSTAGWLASKDQILLKGEVGIEFNPTAESTDKKVRIKIGDGVTTWENLPYFGGEDAHVYEATVAKEEDHIAAITTALNGATPNTHDIAIVKEAIIAQSVIDAAAAENPSRTIEQKYQHTAYRWNGTTWAAFDGNYSAKNVIFDEDFTFTTKIGTVQTLTNGSTKVKAAGKSVKDFFAGLFAAEANPSATAPSVSWSTGSNHTGTLEVGTEITPAYKAGLSAGSYTYGPATGITAKSWDVDIADLTDANKTTSSGSFSKFTAFDDMKNYAKITATASYDAGTIPVTNIGNAYPSKQIKAGSKSITSDGYTAYRAWFCGYKNGNSTLNVDSISSDNIRALTSANGSFTSSLSTNKMQQMLFACPTGKINYTLKDDGVTVNTGFTVANAVNGAPQTVKHKTVYVKGANNYVVSADKATTTNTVNGMAYDLFYVSNGNADSGDATYSISYTTK